MTAAPDDSGLGAAVLKHLSDRGEASTGDLASALKTSVYFVKKALKPLAAKGLIHRSGSTTASRWHLGAAGKRQPGMPAKEAP